MEDRNKNGYDYHDASFSYLRAGDQGLARTSKTSTTGGDDQEGEISVFGAERYFNMIRHDRHHDINNKSSNKIIEGYKKEINNNNINTNQRITKSKSGYGTPSSCSEVSWNSHTALLPTLIRNPSLNKKKKSGNAKYFFFRCGGSCSDKKSTYVHDHHQQEVSNRKYNDDHDHHNHHVPHKHPPPQQPPPPPPPQQQQQQQQRLVVSNKQRIEKDQDQHFAFPILNPGADHHEKSVLQLEEDKDKMINIEEELPRKSLEVFGSNNMKGGGGDVDAVAINLERKLSMMTWDAIPNKASNFTSTTRINEDMESDASSDLFEIENISCSTGFQPLFTRQVSDGMSSCMTPNSRYEPSEASMDWSVVTSSATGGGHGHDTSSGYRDYDEKKLAVNSGRRTAAKIKSGIMDKDVQRNNKMQGGILGCNSHKSVRVAESAYRSTKVKD